MRLIHALLLAPLLAGPVFAAPPPAEVAAPTGEHHGRRTMEQHFADANTPHDGRLTLEQAKAGYKSLAKSFPQIDINHRGYITMDDLRAWKAARKAARQAARPNGGGRSGAALQRGADTRAMNSTSQPSSRPIQVDLPLAPLDRARAS